MPGPPIERKKYKKAQLLIEEAMRLQPNDPTIREYYKKIYPTKNAFIRAKIEINLLLLKAVAYPTRFIWELFKERISYKLILFIILALEVGGLFALLRKKEYINHVWSIYFILNNEFETVKINVEKSRI